MATRNQNSYRDRGVARQPLCPYLLRFDAQQNQVAPVDYPSFENHCLATAGDGQSLATAGDGQSLATAGDGQGAEALLLTDQATFCLSGSYRLCDRFVAIHLEEEPLSVRAFPQDSAPPVQPSVGIPNQATVKSVVESEAEPLREEQNPTWDYRPSRQLWTWASAAVIFAAVLLVGGGIAAYTGWQLVLQGEFLARGQNGQINTLGNVQSAAQVPAFLVVTATVEQPGSDQVAATAPLLTQGQVITQVDQPGQGLPVAVTPTPIVLLPPTAVANAEPGADQAANTQQQPPPAAVPPVNIILPNPDAAATPEAIIDVLEQVPTRRPTPAFELPTSTPVPLEPVPPTATPTLMILGTPVVIFAADQAAVPPGECTKIRWHVENVREVYYDNQAALGDGVEEECIKKEADSYALRVIFGDGQTKIFTTTINILWPTATPTLTPSFTPEPLATETWTPEAPTAVPTPSVIYGVALRLNGNKQQKCNAGTDCEIAVLATNMGDSPDTISVEFLQRGSENAWLCRLDGVCAEQKLSLSNVGPSNTAFIVLRVSVPAESVGTVFTFVLRAISDGSQGTMTSEAVTVEIESQAP